MKNAWISCWLDPSDTFFENINRLGMLLEKRNIRLILFAYEGNFEKYRGFIHFPMRPCVLGSDKFIIQQIGKKKLHKCPIGIVDKLDFLLDEMVEYEAYSRRRRNRIRNIYRKIKTWRSIRSWSRLSALHNPCFIIKWGETGSLSRFHTRMAQRRNVPVFLLEKGPFPGTIIFDAIGQSALSHFTLSVSLFDSDKSVGKFEQHFDVLREYFDNNLNLTQTAANSDIERTTRPIIKDAPGPTILFLGSYDDGCGVTFSRKPLAARFSPIYRSSADAAGALAQSMNRIVSEGTLLIRPHPQDTSDYNHIKLANKRIVREGQVDELIAASDVVVSLLSTTQLRAICFDKPVVLLAHGELYGHGIAYEAIEPNSLDKALQDAVAKVDIETRIRKGRSLIANLFDSYLIGVEDDVPTKCHLPDLAKFLVKFSSYDVCDRDVLD